MPGITYMPMPVPSSSGICRFSVIRRSSQIFTCSLSNSWLAMSSELRCMASSSSRPSSDWSNIATIAPSGIGGAYMPAPTIGSISMLRLAKAR